MRAKADAELAVAMTKNDRALAQADAAQTRLRALNAPTSN
jgi:hypothetical protein